MGTLGRLMIHWGAWLGLLRLFCFVITSASLFGAGCRRGDPVDVVGITGVDSPVISAASPLLLRAEGLPSARRVRVALRGRLAAAGQDERALDVSLVGHVLSPERLSVAVDAARIARWGRATFEGEVVVDCDPPAPRGCHGRLAQARFDVSLGERRAQPLHHAVARLLPALGVVISDADAATFGLLVSEVRDGGLAARAGLMPGDTIVGSNGVSVHALADLAPGPNADALALRVRRPAAVELLSVRVPLAAAPPLADLRLLGLCLAGAPILLWLFVRLGLPAPSLLVSGLRARVRELRRSAGWPTVTGAVLSGVLSSLGAAALDPLGLLLLHLAGVLLLWGLRAHGLSRLAADVLGVWGGALCVVALSGTLGWPLILRDQGALPWAWNVLSRLPLSAAGLLFVVSAARMHRALGRRAAGRLSAELWEQGLAALLASLCAGLFLGGLAVSPSAGALSLSLALVGAALKGMLCFGLLRVLAGVKLLKIRRWTWVALIAITPLWVRLSPGRAFELVWGSVVCVLLCCVALAGLVTERTPQHASKVHHTGDRAGARRRQASLAQPQL